ncbi:FAD-dependent monooxygenase [Enterovibrio sp. 27052020O]|uniref:FAD-dependent monooxygenase n=1 Tax=Enterovibrio sp. 27052020O TaxID=3241166 RepID=UPI00388EDEA9
MDQDKVQIIGAGIGGLTLANALEQRGISVSLFERASEIRAVGAGIILPPNAIEIFEALGLSDAIRECGQAVERYCIKSQKGKTFNQLYVTKTSRLPAVAISRHYLHQILASAITPSAIKLGHALDTLNPLERLAEFDNGHKQHYHILVGADGIRSKVRDCVFGQTPLRDANQACFRGLVTVENLGELSSQFYELWGSGSRFGFVQVNQSQFYWYATFSKQGHAFSPCQPILEQLQHYFKDWWWPVSRLLKAQAADTMIETPLLDRKPASQWYSNAGVVLLGDAIHPTTPNLGQGAAMAIESAYSLADVIANNLASPDFSIYQAQRQKRTTMINRQSWMIGRMANITNPLLCGLRDLAMDLTTDKVATDQYRRMVNWLPASLAK